jgi:hypothetical protein
MSVPKIKEIHQRELGSKNSRGTGYPSSAPAQKVARVEESTEMLRILHEPEENHFKGIATGDESWFQYSYPSSKIFARSPTNVIPRTRRAIGAKKTIIIISFTGPKLIGTIPY